MKYRGVPHLLAVWLAALIVWPAGLSAYDPPDFDFEVFSSDGIFLPAEQRNSLLEALAALASNFTGNPRVDDDLREKALAIALRIDPMHYHSRQAHRALAQGTSPAATSYFDSLTVVSETLWNLAKPLSSPPLQPDGVRLAPYLMELSLITHPEPPSERLDLYASATEGKYPLWEKFTTLDPAGNRSTSRTVSIRSEADAIFKAMRDRARPASPSMTGNRPPQGGPSPRPPRPEPAGPVAASLTLLPSIVEVDGTPVAGRVSLTIRPPRNRAERELIGNAAGSSPSPPVSPVLPLVASNAEIPVSEVRIPTTLASDRSWTWPAGAVGEIAFTPLGRSTRGRPATLPTVLPQATILVSSLLGNSAINGEIIVSGQMNDAASAPVIGDPLATLGASRILGKKYLLIPASAFQALVASLQETGKLSLLFQTELLAYSSLDEALALATSPTDPLLAEASAAFDEIEAVSTRMSLPDLSRNAKVQERLEAILTKYPNHLSARAMLAFGRLPVTREMRISEFAAQVEALIEPFVDLKNVEELEAAKARLAEAQLQLAQLRREPPAEVKSLIPPLTNLLVSAGLYLNLTNRVSDIAQDRLDDVTGAFRDLESGLTTLGIDSAVVAKGASRPVVIEAESFVDLVELTRGQASAQELIGLPDSWSGDHQLWWTGGRPGDTCTFTLKGIASGTRTITIHPTTAENYATARISIRNLFKEVDFYSREFTLGEPLVFENVTVDTDGILTIEFQIIGRNSNSVPSFFLGIDRIEVQ